ncbi:MAG: metallophosphoesterase [Deltaproteobacteria bacterium]|nr:metallophosphoesterase [Deltaproteobacteria bacterium]
MDEASGRVEGPELVVISDLHLGEGRTGDAARYSPMEDFFEDAALARLLASLRTQHAGDPSRLVLVLNGDVFDFLTVTSVPDDEDCRARGFEVSPPERRFGLDPTPAKSVFKLDVIAAGHEEAFVALASFVAAGHRIEILRGNHDLELHFEDVQRRLREHLAGFEGGPAAKDAERLVRFHEWFYLEPGRVYVEHGNEYEPSNSIRYPLRPLVPSRGKPAGAPPLLDYPLGSYFVRYFYNRVHRIDPYMPRVISFEQYTEFLRRYDLFDLVWVARDHYPFFVSALSPGAIAGASRYTREDDAAHEDALRGLDGITQPAGLYRRLEELKIHPLTASKAALVREMIEPVVRRLLWFAGLGLLSLYLWLLVFSLIQSTPWLAENVFGKASLLALFSVLTVAGLFWAGNQIGRRLRRRTDETVEKCAERASEIARFTGVKAVVMGHTHVVDVRKVDGGRATYANGGTWIAVDNPWNRLKPDARRLTFIRVRGDDVRVCRWNDEAGRVDDVPFFDLAEDRGRERMPADEEIRLRARPRAPRRRPFGSS